MHSRTLMILAAHLAFAPGPHTSALAEGRPPRGAAGSSRPLGDLTGPWILFVDDHAVAEKSGVRRTYHEFTKHAGNPVLAATEPWEGKSVYVYGTVLPREDGTGYRLWYHGYNPDGRFGGKRGYFNAYAESDDGLRWTKPNLGLVEWRGSTANNMFLTRKRSPGDDHHPQVIHTPWDPDPNRRYKLLTFAYYDGYWASYSPDGIHWRDVEKNPVLVDPGDVGNFVWDARTQRFLGYPKIWVDDVRGHKRRCVGFTQTTNFESWPKSKLILVPDEYDDRWTKGGDAHTDFYGLSAFPYESAYLGFLWVYRIAPGDNRIHIELVSSQDGVQWVRQEEPRTPILPLGEPGEWDDGMLFTTNHPLVEGDTIKLFYGGFDGPHDAAGPNGAIGLATLRKDGFASLDAGEETGVVTTKSIKGVSGPLRVNAEAQGGSVVVEVLDTEGNALLGYGRGDCDPVISDGVDQVVTWRSRKKLPEGSGPVAFRFVMEHASLYSFAVGEGAKMGRE